MLNGVYVPVYLGKPLLFGTIRYYLELLFDNRERKVNRTWNYYPDNDYGNISFIYGRL